MSLNPAVETAKTQKTPRRTPNLVVWLLARLLGLPMMETQVVVLLASLAVGANVYLMSRQVELLEGPVAGSLILKTGLADWKFQK